MTDSGYAPSDQFTRLLAMLDDLPNSVGVFRLRCEIANYPNFFPGGRGYKTKFFPLRPVMFIGHNFDTEEGFRLSVARGTEDYSRMKTWVNLRDYFLPAAKLDEAHCFFTNFYLGAIVHPEPQSGKQKKTSNTGAFRCSNEYHKACVDALKTQVEIVRPKVIALLGTRVPSAFGEAFSAYAPWSIGGLAEIQSRQPVGGHIIDLLSNLRVSVISLVHPANPRSIESHRAQGTLLRAAIEAANSS